METTTEQPLTKPILFQTDMVRAILSGLKTQTRRTKGLDEINENPDEWIVENMEYKTNPENDNRSFVLFETKDGQRKMIKKPYGDVGDILWVRETWADASLGEPLSPKTVVYKADYSDDILNEERNKGFWKPSIFMPKKACRIFLEVKDVRIERLFDTSEYDAIREGVRRFKCYEENGLHRFVDYRFKRDADERYLKDHSFSMATSSFFSLWKSINGKKSLQLNPYVFVYEFFRTQKPQNFLNK